MSAHYTMESARGVRFGRLLVVEILPKSSCRCRCDCGALKIAKISHLRSGTVRSCGCLKRAVVAAMGKATATHGLTRSSEHKCWASMKQRCFNQKNKWFAYYGGRGITVCARWLSFEKFLADVGRKPTPKHSLDRIDNDGNYEPGNCRWATHSQQMKNRRPSREAA